MRSIRDPTELKAAGGMAERPEFAILFNAGCATASAPLRAFYGAGALDIDFRAMGERAAGVRLQRADLKWERVERKSGRTGQVHSLGGFTGEAEYEGELAEFLPWLRAARWVGWDGRRCGVRGKCGWRTHETPIADCACRPARYEPEPAMGR